MSVLKEIGIGSRNLDDERDFKFRLESRHIAALVERHLPRIKTPNFWKVLVLCCSELPKPPTRNCVAIGGVFEVYVRIDPNTFFDLDTHGKKKFILDAIKSGLAMASEHTGIGTEEFKEALRLSQSLVNEWPCPESPRCSQDRKWKASLLCCHDIDRFTAHLIVMDKTKQEVARAFVFETPPSEHKFVPLMFAPEWISSDEIVVGDHRWKWDADKLRLTKK